MKNEDKKVTELVLPLRLVTSVDLSRVTRELRMIDDWLIQASLRQSGTQVTPPKTSATLEELARVNEVSLLEPANREKMIAMLVDFAEKAPRLHMSFAVEPSASFLNRMIVWLRTNINPHILLEVGLQPTLAAGCTARTVNRLFDMSLRHRFVESRPLLVQSIAKFADENTNMTVNPMALEEPADAPVGPATPPAPAATTTPPVAEVAASSAPTTAPLQAIAKAEPAAEVAEVSKEVAK